MRVVAAAVFASLAVLLAILQVAALIVASRRKRGYSLVPFLGALLWIAACLAAPWEQSWVAMPFALLVDPTPVLFAAAALKGAFSK